MAFVAVVALATGCAGTWGGEHRTARVANVSTAALAGAAMAADWCGTRHAAATRHDDFEGGMPTAMVIGGSPSTGAVDAYFAIGTVALAGAAQLVPERWRWLAYGAVAAVEIKAVHNNLSTTRCGPVGRY
jgi:hypothetical protein